MAAITGFFLNLKDGAAGPIGTLNGLARQLRFQLIPAATVGTIGNDMHAFAPRKSGSAILKSF
jgi:hypothetical protein